MGRDLEKRMGGYGVGPMPVRNAEETVFKPKDDDEADPDDIEEPATATPSPKKVSALGRAAMNKS